MLSKPLSFPLSLLAKNEAASTHYSSKFKSKSKESNDEKIRQKLRNRRTEHRKNKINKEFKYKQLNRTMNKKQMIKQSGRIALFFDYPIPIEPTYLLHH